VLAVLAPETTRPAVNVGQSKLILYVEDFELGFDGFQSPE